MRYENVDKPREEDRICYLSNLTKMQAHYPERRLTKSPDDFFMKIFESWKMHSAG
jgi:CDP-paratose 2-epimerase